MKLLFKLYNNVYNKEFKRIPILYLYIMIDIIHNTALMYIEEKTKTDS